jgi:hypothetical protein
MPTHVATVADHVERSRSLCGAAPLTRVADKGAHHYCVESVGQTQS